MSETKSRPAKGAAHPGRGGLLAWLRGLGPRFALWVRQIVAELRKVIWPTRKELGTYTTVVLVFVAAIALIVSVLDLLFTKAVLAVFGH